MSVEVIKPGLLTTLQDRGRPGYAHLGIGRAGAFDGPALRIANALCGNAADACGLEFALHGPALRFHTDAWIALTGAPLRFQVDGADQSTWAPVHVAAGATATFGAMHSGCRGYLAVRGGFDVEPVLGSRSTDLNARLGPFDGRTLRTGDTLPIAPAAQRDPPAAMKPGHWRLDPHAWFARGSPTTLRLLPGTHLDRLDETSRRALFSEHFTVHVDSNRVGLRLSGPTLAWMAPLEVTSEGCVPGLLQLPPAGQPIAFGPECPVSGGYPRLGKIAEVDLPRLAQLRAGDALRFAACTFAEALHARQRRDHALAMLECAIAARLHESR